MEKDFLLIGKKKGKKYFKKDTPKTQSESFFIAMHNDEIENGLAIAARLLKTYLFYEIG